MNKVTIKAVKGKGCQGCLFDTICDATVVLIIERMGLEACRDGYIYQKEEEGNDTIAPHVHEFKHYSTSAGKGYKCYCGVEVVHVLPRITDDV